MSNVHRVKNNVVKHYRIIPYQELADVLNDDGAVFLETTSDLPLKRSTVWKAARRLSEMVGRKVRYDRAFLRVDGVDVLEGYSFSIEDPESQDRKDTS